MFFLNIGYINRYSQRLHQIKIAPKKIMLYFTAGYFTSSFIS
jgi:hypothetical protein